MNRESTEKFRPPTNTAVFNLRHKVKVNKKYLKNTAKRLRYTYIVIKVIKKIIAGQVMLGKIIIALP